jgi:hypothetical protein
MWDNQCKLQRGKPINEVIDPRDHQTNFNRGGFRIAWARSLSGVGRADQALLACWWRPPEDSSEGHGLAFARPKVPRRLREQQSQGGRT